ncbi:non-ribosomal peptide synthetase [Rhodococcus rhodochrous]|uniref:non-ribosomal peptide synthetase n=1 Tax=Rhodococcus rhodochrous TaxID=1829 RepID=UPI000751A512|nr:non-ribosomal peptide synthetase [Rhodococcus rhodochrous]MDO1486852.1 non-ribosomal peptide synthetase [Rhodococcus rhodochrous]SNV28444.1 non-ribosomal peptide synthetase [Rhodococcus rhodochrous]
MMRDTTTTATAAYPSHETLSPIQRAYLVGGQDGLELSGPARYYLGCDLNTERVAEIGTQLRRLVRSNDILRVSAASDLSLSTLPADVARDIDVDVRWVDDADFDAANDAVRREYSSDTFAFGDWPQFEITAVRSPHRARLHLVYALWLMDAASLAVFLTELVSHRDDAGDAVGQDRTADIPPIRLRALNHPRRDRSVRDERFWRDRATALPDPAELPLRPEWRHAGLNVTHRMVTINSATAGKINKLASAHAITPSMVYLAAYGVVLGQLGGGLAHTVTVLHSQQTGTLTPNSLGNRGNTMPLAIPATTGQSFVEIARVVQGRYLSQAMHASLSGTEIARLANPAADLRRLAHPFAFTALEVDGLGEVALGLRRRWDEVQLRVPQVLMDHQVIRDSDGSVRLGFDWRTDAFDIGFAEEFVARCANFVRELAESDERWTRPPSTYPRAHTGKASAQHSTETLHDRVLRCAAAAPKAPAVHDAQGTLSYAELVGRARAVARLLLDAGARTGDRVAVHLPRGRGQVIAILGSLLAGCVYIPLDYGTPEGRLDSIARRGAVRFVFTDGQQSARKLWTRSGVYPLQLPVGAPPLSDRQAASTPSPPSPTAYIIFTSGSTGEPKGVVISHAGAINTIDAVNDEFGVTETDRVLSVSSIGFDLSVYDVFGPLLRGGSVVMLTEESAKNPAEWVKLIERHGVTLWNSAPALASLLEEEGSATPSVRAFLLSGDWIPLTLPGALRRLAPGSEVISLGGATEGSIWSIFHRVNEADCTGRSIPYGKALPGQDILVLDAERNVCPDWQIGEIYIAGAGVADGYANDQSKTEAAFLDDPAFGRIYRTGDRGRRHPGGVVEFLGRTDNQIKLNGHRVELGEIEHLIENTSGIRRCVVCVRGSGRRKQVVAYVTLAADVSDTWRQDVNAVLKNALPSYMIPDALVELNEIPLNGNGKLDRRRLESLPFQETPAREASPARQQDLHSHEVARCWQDVLGEAPSKGSFFEAGGGSYDAIRLLSLLRSRFGYEVSFGDFMADPTAPGLAALCRRTRTSDTRGVWTHKPRSSATPRLRLVLFPPVGGGVSCYTDLIQELGGDVDVHVIGLDAPLVDGDDGRANLTGLARRCLQELPEQTLLDGVPLVFAGWSFGGSLAYEAARVCDSTVARVVVVDTPVSEAARRGGGGVDELSLNGFLRDIHETSGVRIDAEQAATDPALSTRFEVYRQNMTLLRDWTPCPSPVPLVEFRAAVDPAEPDAAAWGRIARREEASALAGGHFSVFGGDNTQRIRDAIEGVKSDDWL